MDFSVWPAFLMAMALAIAGIEVLTALLAVFRARWWYPRRIRPKYDPGYLPRCAIIIPTKGVPPNFRENLAAHLELDYPDYEIIYAVEASDDPGVPVIEGLVAGQPRARLIVAGLARTGCQQNHNMLAGVRAAAEAGARVFAFADNDIAPAPHWLRSLVLPLSSPEITVATGYRWLCGRRGTFGEHVHTFMNMTMYAQFSLLALLTRRGLWGGSFAMRREDFEALEVGPRWAETVSDDMSLMGIMDRHGLKAMLVSEVLVVTDDVFERSRDAVSWFSRQLLNVKAYERWTWALAIGPAMAGVCLLGVWPFAALLGAALTGASFWSLGGGAGLVFYAGECTAAALYALLGPVRRHGLLVARAPLLRAAQWIAYFRTIGADSLVWAGVYYRFNRRGQVVEIRRPDPISTGGEAPEPPAPLGAAADRPSK